MVVAAVTLAFCSLFAWIIPFIGIPVCLASIVVGGIGWAKKRVRIASFLAVFIGAIGLVLGIINAFLGFLIWSL
jgi:hypothetical protein